MSHPYQMPMADLNVGSFDWTGGAFQSELDLLEPLRRDVSQHEMSQWIQSGVFPQSLTRQPLMAPTGAIVRRTTYEAMKRWLFRIMPLRFNNALSMETKIRIYEDTVADRLAVAAAPREVSFREMSYKQAFRRYGLAGSKWDINLMYPEGQAELAMQIKQINDGVFTAIAQDAISGLLRTDQYYRKWASKAYWPRMTEDQWRHEETTNWNVLAMMEKGAEYICAHIDHIQSQFQGQSNCIIMSVKSMIYNTQIKKDNMDYQHIGPSTSGFNNKYASVTPVDSIKGNSVYVITPFQTSNDTVYDPLLRRNRQIGEYHIIANRFMYQDSHKYSSNDLSIAVYDEDEDTNKRIDMYIALEMCGFFDHDGYLLPPTHTLGGGGNRGYGSGSIEDLKADFLSKDDPTNPTDRIAVRLMGEIGYTDIKFFQHFTEVFLRRVAHMHGYNANGSNELANILLRGENLLRRISQNPFNAEWFTKFLTLNYHPASAVLPPTDRIFKAPADLRQLDTVSGGAFYKFPVDDLNPQKLHNGHFGTANLWALEEFAKQGELLGAGSQDVKDAKAYVEAVHLIVRELQAALPLCQIIDKRLTPLAVRLAREPYSFFVNCIANTTCFLWVNLADPQFNPLTMLAQQNIFSFKFTTRGYDEDADAHLQSAITAHRASTEDIAATVTNVANKLGSKYARNEFARGILQFLGMNRDLFNQAANIAVIKYLHQRFEEVGARYFNVRDFTTIRGGNNNPVTAENLKKMLNALIDARLAAVAYGILAYDPYYKFWEGEKKTDANAPFALVDYIKQVLDQMEGLVFADIASAEINTPEINMVRNGNLNIFDFLLRQGGIESRLQPTAAVDHTAMARFAAAFLAEHTAQFTYNEALRTSFLDLIGLRYNITGRLDNALGMAQFDNAAPTATEIDAARRYVRTHPFIHIRPSSVRAFANVLPVNQEAMSQSFFKLLDMFNGNGTYEEVERRLDRLVNGLVRGSVSETRDFSFQRIIDWVRSHSEEALDIFYISSGRVQDLIDSLRVIQDELDAAVARNQQQQRAASTASAAAELKNLISSVESNVGYNTMADGSNLVNGERLPKARYVQTALTFTPELVTSLVDYYGSRGYMSDRSKIPFVLPSSPFDPDQCGTLADLLNYRDKIVNARRTSDYPSTLRPITENLFAETKDFFFVSRLISGQANLEAADSLVRKQELDARQLRRAEELEDYQFRMRKNNNQYLLDVYIDLMSGSKMGTTGAAGSAISTRRGALSQQSGSSLIPGSQQTNLDGGYSRIYGGGASFGSSPITSALSDLRSENLTTQFGEYYRRLPEVIKTTHGLGLARALLFASANKYNFRSMLDADLPVPFEALGLKHLMRYDTYSFVKIADAGRAAIIIFGNPLYTVSNYGIEQRRHHVFTCTGGLVMLDHRNVFVYHDAHVINRGGGASTKPYDPRMQLERPQDYYRPDARKYGYGGESVIWALVPYGFHKDAPISIDITGHPWKKAARGIVTQYRAKELDYPTAFRVCALWGIRGGGGVDDTVDPYDNERQSTAVYNTECYRGYTYYWDRAAGKFTNSAKVIAMGHWGEKGTYAGVQKARHGGADRFEPPTGSDVPVSF